MHARATYEGCRVAFVVSVGSRPGWAALEEMKQCLGPSRLATINGRIPIRSI
jgi:hypothetical protein